MEDGLHASLDPDQLSQHARPLGRLASTAVGILVGNPDFRHEAGGVQFRQGRGVDLVDLDAGVGDRAHQPRIGDNDALHVRAHEALDGSAVACHLDHDLIFEAQRLGESDERFVGKLDPHLFRNLPILKNSDLGERSVDVHADDLHAMFSNLQEPVACTTSTDPRSQRSRASRRGGQVITRARSSWS